MPLAATCPHCRTAHRLADDLDRRMIRCKVCREPFRVGGDRPGDDYDDEPRPRRRRSRSSSSALIPLLVIGGVLGVGVLIIGGAAIWYLASRAAKAGPAVVTRRVSPNAVMTDHSMFPPQPPGVGLRPAQATEGREVVMLSNTRRVEGVIPGRPAYQVDYKFLGDPPKRNDWYYLVAKVPAGVCETHLYKVADQPQGTISFNFFPGTDLAQGFELWVEFHPAGKTRDRTRVSKPVTLN
jgi:hypothetical protein